MKADYFAVWTNCTDVDPDWMFIGKCQSDCVLLTLSGVTTSEVQLLEVLG